VVPFLIKIQMVIANFWNFRRQLRNWGIPVGAILLLQVAHTNPMTGIIDPIEMEVRLPNGFSEQYKELWVRKAEPCSVKKHLESPPLFSVGHVALAHSFS